jgi:hypothetical protein
MPSVAQKKESIFCTAAALAPVQNVTPIPSYTGMTNQYGQSEYDKYYEVARDYEKFWNERQFKTLRASLGELESLQANWNTYGAAAPSAEAVKRASAALTIIQNAGYQPSMIVPSGEGGVAICFTSVSSYADIEFLNSGETLAVAYQNNEEPEVWPLDGTQQGVTNTLKQIQNKLTNE